MRRDYYNLCSALPEGLIARVAQHLVGEDAGVGRTQLKRLGDAGALAYTADQVLGVAGPVFEAPIV